MLPNRAIKDYTLYEKQEDSTFVENYYGYDAKRQREVFVKIMNNKNFPDLSQIRLHLTNEIQALTQLKQKNAKNVILLIDQALTQNNSYLIYENMKFQTLKAYLDYKKMLTENECINYLIQIYYGYMELFGVNNKPRDMQLSNFLRGEEDNIRIDDFGIFKFFYLQKNSQANYRINEAPETQKDRTQYTHEKSDSWSMGVILYQLMFAQDPSFLNREVVIPSTRLITQQIVDLLYALLAYEPSARLGFSQILNHTLVQNFINREKNKEGWTQLLGSVLNPSNQRTIDRYPQLAQTRNSADGKPLPTNPKPENMLESKQTKYPTLKQNLISEKTVEHMMLPSQESAYSGYCLATNYEQLLAKINDNILRQSFTSINQSSVNNQANFPNNTDQTRIKPSNNNTNALQNLKAEQQNPQMSSMQGQNYMTLSQSNRYPQLPFKTNNISGAQVEQQQTMQQINQQQQQLKQFYQPQQQQQMYPSQNQTNQQNITIQPTQNQQDQQNYGVQPSSNQQNQLNVAMQQTQNQQNQQNNIMQPSSNQQNQQNIAMQQTQNQSNQQKSIMQPSSNQQNQQNIAMQLTQNQQNQQKSFMQPNSNQQNQVIQQNQNQQKLVADQMKNAVQNNQQFKQQAQNTPQNYPILNQQGISQKGKEQTTGVSNSNKFENGDHVKTNTQQMPSQNSQNQMEWEIVGQTQVPPLDCDIKDDFNLQNADEQYHLSVKESVFIVKKRKKIAFIHINDKEKGAPLQNVDRSKEDLIKKTQAAKAEEERMFQQQVEQQMKQEAQRNIVQANKPSQSLPQPTTATTAKTTTGKTEINPQFQTSLIRNQSEDNSESEALQQIIESKQIFDKNVRYLEEELDKFNVLAQTVERAEDLLQAKNNFWVVVSFFILKRLYLFRKELEEQLEAQVQVDDCFGRWEEFCQSVEYRKFMNKLRKQNEIIFNSAESLRKLTQKRIQRLSPSVSSELLKHLPLEETEGYAANFYVHLHFHIISLQESLGAQQKEAKVELMKHIVQLQDILLIVEQGLFVNNPEFFSLQQHNAVQTSSSNELIQAYMTKKTEKLKMFLMYYRSMGYNL